MSAPIIARSFRDCTVSERLLYSVFLLLVGMGYIAALGLVYMTHEGLDGKHGIDVQDIAISYYGNRSGTAMEEMLRGPMRVHSTPIDTARLVTWLQSGASRRGYTMVARPILKKDCFACHSGATAKSLHVPDFSTFGGVRSVTTVNPGASILSLVKLSHIHLFGIGLLLFVTGWIFRFAVLNRWLKWTLIVVPFLAIFADILAWFLTKWDPTYVYVVVVGGALMGCAWGAQIMISLYQLWFLHGQETPVEPH